MMSHSGTGRGWAMKGLQSRSGLWGFESWSGQKPPPPDDIVLSPCRRSLRQTPILCTKHVLHCRSPGRPKVVQVFLCYWESARKTIVCMRVIDMPMTMSVIWGWTSGTWLLFPWQRVEFCCFFQLWCGCFVGQFYYTHCKQMVSYQRFTFSLFPSSSF